MFAIPAAVWRAPAAVFVAGEVVFVALDVMSAAQDVVLVVAPHVKADEFDAKFDRGADITSDLDLGRVRRHLKETHDVQGGEHSVLSVEDDAGNGELAGVRGEHGVGSGGHGAPGRTQQSDPARLSVPPGAVPRAARRARGPPGALLLGGADYSEG
ncbi:MAG: hypothetical protein GEV04_19775 [Actinophytocola sp.]|nr:hypothetical protein [Actinophytocola sp.]